MKVETFMLHGEIVVNGMIVGILLLMSILLGFLSYEVRNIIESFSHMDANTISILSSIIGAIIASFSTYIFTDRHWKKKLKTDERNVALSFYNEIKDIEQIIKPLLDACKKYGIIDDNDIQTYGHFGSVKAGEQFLILA